MDYRVDLHLHTTASDGRWPPEQLIDQVQQEGIGFFAVTDHDSLGSLAQATRLVRGSGLRFLPGVELSSRLNGQWYHLLAYGLDPTDPELQAFAQANRARLLGASNDSIRVLAEAGYPVSMEDFANYTWDRRRGGWKALNYLIDLGISTGARHYFDELFRDLPHPQADFPSPEVVIGVAQRAGATVVLAHPGVYFSNGPDTQRLDQLVELGLQGIECYSCQHDEETTKKYLAYTRSRDLLVTGGSDCHGGFVGRALGSPRVHLSDLRLGELEEKVIT